MGGGDEARADGAGFADGCVEGWSRSSFRLFRKVIMAKLRLVDTRGRKHWIENTGLKNIEPR
jgi:hypothetical protein